MATGTVKPPPADLRRPRGRESLSTRPPTRLTTRPAGASNNGPRTHRHPRTLLPTETADPRKTATWAWSKAETERRGPQHRQPTRRHSRSRRWRSREDRLRARLSRHLHLPPPLRPHHRHRRGQVEKVLSSHQILCGKLERVDQRLVRDVFDVLTAVDEEPAALSAAAGMVSQQRAAAIESAWRNAAGILADKLPRLIRGARRAAGTRLGPEAAAAFQAHRYPAPRRR